MKQNTEAKLIYTPVPTAVSEEESARLGELVKNPSPELLAQLVAHRKLERGVRRVRRG